MLNKSDILSYFQFQILCIVNYSVNCLVPSISICNAHCDAQSPEC